MSENGLGAQIAGTLADALAALEVIATSPPAAEALLARAGIDVTLDDGAHVALAGLLPGGDDLETLLAVAADVAAGEPVSAADVVVALDAAASIVSDIAGLASLPADSYAGLPPPLDDPATWSDLARAILDQLIAGVMEHRLPAVYGPLRLAAVFNEWTDPATGAAREAVDWSKLGGLLTDPGTAFRAGIGWADQFAHDRLLDAALDVARRLSFPARLIDVSQEQWQQYFAPYPTPYGVKVLRLPVFTGYVPDLDAVATVAVDVVPVPAEPGGPITGLLVANRTTASVDFGIDLDGPWKLEVVAGSDASSALAIELYPGRPVEIIEAPPSFLVGLGFVAEPDEPWRLGSPNGLHIALHGLAVDLVATGSPTDPEFSANLSAPGQGLVLALGGSGDSFVTELLGTATASFDLDAEWSSRHGFTLRGGVALDLVIPLDLTVGPVTFEQIDLGMTIGSPSAASAGLLVSAAIGPVNATIDGIGLDLELEVGDDAASGQVGPFTPRLAFKPPEGIGLGIESDVASGGGYLYIDGNKYAGVLALELLEVGISAVALIDTDPVEVDGWSMFFALFIEVPAIPLGFGFNLTGVGGLVGINRTMDVEALQAGVRSGALDAVLFPEDPIAEAPVVIDQLQSMFPPAAASYVFGPVVQISWGPSSLIEAEVGIVIALPDPVTIAVLGSVSSVLPSPDADLVALNLDVLGIIDFAAGELSIDASLHHSHVIGFALSGDMALRAGFGDQPSFLMSLGGFHPGFTAPAGFPTLRRLSLAINAGSIISIHFECYMALTSNTVQFGAALHLSATIAGFGIEGGTEFDALIQFSPFELTTRLAFEISIKAATVDLAGVWLEATVTGPNPWYLVGTARFKILGIEEELRVDERIGQPRPDPELPAEDLFPVLLTALGEAESWSVVAAPSSGVVLAEVDIAEGELLVSPDGAVAVSQRAVPLAISIDKVGNAPLDEYDVFNLEAGEGLDASAELDDWFAPGHFFEIPPGEKLSTPSFERLGSGLEFGGGPVAAGPARQGTLSYEEILRDPELDVEVSDGRWVPRNDPRSDVISEISSVAGTTAIAVEGQADVAVVDVPFAVVEVASGNVQAIATRWSSARHTIMGRDPGHVVVPQWETA